MGAQPTLPLQPHPCPAAPPLPPEEPPPSTLPSRRVSCGGLAQSPKDGRAGKPSRWRSSLGKSKRSEGTQRAIRLLGCWRTGEGAPYPSGASGPSWEGPRPRGLLLEHLNQALGGL